ncbi:MAG: hypothetical protein ACFFFB_23820 [Candidatus Heimdallarchaeota archaeon]
MKKSYLVFLVIISVIEVILAFLLVYFPVYNIIILVFMIIAPIIVPLTWFIYTSLSPLLDFALLREDEQRPPSYKEFQLTNPYFCESCSNYTSHLMKYCENCGAENSLRNITKKDNKQYLKSHKKLFKA